eukprot:5190926-Prymnesium_polylepis.1
MHSSSTHSRRLRARRSELNKLRMTAELADSDMRRPLDQIAKPHWDEGAISLQAHLQQQAQHRGMTVRAHTRRPPPHARTRRRVMHACTALRAAR